MKCLVLETFATVDIAGRKGEVIDIPLDEAKRHEYNHLVKILNPEETLPIAYETMEEAVEGRQKTDATPMKPKRNRRPRPVPH